jgi:hypothetical protein
LSAIASATAETMIVCLEWKFQSKHVNYAKQSQFSKKSNVYNRNYDNELQRKNEIGHLVKTNPIQTQIYPPLRLAGKAKFSV